MPIILIDADACPVKDECYRVAERYSFDVVVVANSWMRIPREDFIRMQVVPGNFDAADDWIAEHAGPNTIVITNDILLAQRCIGADAFAVIGATGKEFTASSIGGQVATRAIMADLRAGVGTENIGGPAPFSKADRSRFLQALDLAAGRLKRVS